MDTHEKPLPVEANDDVADVAVGTPARPKAGEHFQTILDRRLARRTFLQGSAVLGAMAATPAFLTARDAEASEISFARIDNGFNDLTADEVIVPENYDYKVLIRWGDSLFSRTPDLDVASLNDAATSDTLSEGAAERQADRFGYNCDFNGYFPLPSFDSSSSTRGLFTVNHEYTNSELIFIDFPSFGAYLVDPSTVENYVDANPQTVGVEQAAHGVTIVEIRKTAGRGRDRNWEYVKDSPYNRRLTGNSEMLLTGRAAGDELLQTSADPSGTLVKGTLNNCAGGKTPWGTYCTAEENFDQYFGNFAALQAAADAGDASAQKYVAFHTRVPMPAGTSSRGWERVDTRFDIGQEPKEPFRFGWIVEIDPYDPTSTPKKRTELGRFKHEGANTIIAPGGQAVVYSGDDARDEYLYKFVTTGTFDPNDRQANLDLLDSGILYAARFNEDGTGEWLPLVFGVNGLIPASGFNSQAEVQINARGAADVLGATPLDRPEDVEPSNITGKVYVTLTNNTRRTGGTRIAQGREVTAEANNPNPRGGSQPGNPFGHILELTETGDDATATTFTWEIFLLCGDPAVNLITDPADLETNGGTTPVPFDSTYFAGFNEANLLSALGSPDNVAFDRHGNLWIATDGSQPLGANNAVFACPTAGPNRGRVEQFLSGPVDCEICGPEFTPDSQTFFCGVQHPGDGEPLPNPTSDWPDRGGLPPRPSVISVVKVAGRGREIGS